MCGIFGVSGQFITTQPEDKFIRHATIAGAVRGLDATGYVFLTNSKVSPTTYLKKAVNGATFVNEVWNPEWNMGSSTHSIIGHNRAATVGSINDDTAHPFIEGNIIGVHNGTLTGDWRGDLQVSRKTDVDSRGLYRAISARGIDWAISNLYGAAALVWAEIDSQRMFVYRNADRPLHYTENVDTNKVYYASEAGMLTWLLGKVGIKHGEVKAFNVNTLYEITGGTVKVLRTLPRAVKSYPQRGSANSGQQITYHSAATTNSSNKNNSSATGGTQQQSSGTSGTASQSTSTKDTKLPTPSEVLSGKVDADLGRTAQGNLRWQSGVGFRGQGVSKAEQQRGIVGEWAEKGFKEYTCMCCDKPITTAGFLEDVEDGEIKIHHDCFDTYRAEMDPVGKLIAIVRDVKLRKTA